MPKGARAPSGVPGLSTHGPESALINEHRPMWDGDDLVFYSIKFTDSEGTRHLVEASLNKVPLPPPWVKLIPVKARGGT